MKNKIKIVSIILLFSAFMMCISCGQKENRGEKIIEDGVEVVINHIEPYRIKGEPSTFSLEKEFVIDTERDDIVELGLADIGHYFIVDSEGNIYLISPKNRENAIFKFDSNGNFITSCGRRGRGPGELIFRPFPPLFLIINPENEITVTNFYRRKLVFFKKNGVLIREKKLDSNLLAVIPLKNDKYLVFGNLEGGSTFSTISLSLCNSEFKKIIEFGTRKIPDERETEKIKGIYYTFPWGISDGKIFAGLQDKGYEINVYDLDGNLIRKIKKEYRHVPINGEYKKEYLKIYENYREFREKIYFPNNYPPFHSFFTDDEGRLFVMTYERGERPGEYIYDIFNKEGLFVGRRSLKVYHHPDGLFAIIKNNHLYCLQEKESGYKELVVYRVTWEK
jgi:hypothetical protein